MKTISVVDLKKRLGKLLNRYVFERKNQYHLVYENGIGYQSHDKLIAVFIGDEFYQTAHPIKNRWTELYLSRWSGMDKTVRAIGIENEDFTLITGIKKFRKNKLSKKIIL